MHALPLSLRWTAGLLSAVGLLLAPTVGTAGVFDTLDKIDKSVSNTEQKIDQTNRIKDTTKRVGSKTGDLADEVVPDDEDSHAPPPSPPPPSAPKPFFFESIGGGRQAVPAEQVGGLISSGKVLADTLAWSEGMTDWKPAGEIPSLRGHFAALPPPLPPRR